MKRVTITIEADAHTLLVNAAKQYGMKLLTMIGAWGRGWAMLTPEQQAQAIRQEPIDTRLVSATRLEPAVSDIQRNGLRLGCDVSQLNVLINEALDDDGQIDVEEKNRVRLVMRRVFNRLEETAQLVA